MTQNRVPCRGLRSLGAYKLFGRIGSGGMATVHLAQKRGAEDWLAIKRIHPHLAARSDVQNMFLNEARILAQLDHPVICGVLDSSFDGKAPYFVMRYLHGVPLAAVITQFLTLGRALPVNLMAYIAATVCEGLHYAHEVTGQDGRPLGLVHRDISPQNIFVTFDGRVHLLDFGVAKATGAEALSQTGRIKGKYAYMSPEQVSAQRLDRRSDIFSLGIVLWEALTGRHLFKRNNDAATLRAIKTAAVPAPSELNPDVPQQLDAIVARSLVADPARRYATADALGSALWRYLTTAPNPVGSDELAEVLSGTFPPPPTPEERARGTFGAFVGWTTPEAEPLARVDLGRGPAIRDPMSQDDSLAPAFGSAPPTWLDVIESNVTAPAHKYGGSGAVADPAPATAREPAPVSPIERPTDDADRQDLATTVAPASSGEAKTVAPLPVTSAEQAATVESSVATVETRGTTEGDRTAVFVPRVEPATGLGLTDRPPVGRPDQGRIDRRHRGPGGRPQSTLTDYGKTVLPDDGTAQWPSSARTVTPRWPSPSLGPWLAIVVVAVVLIVVVLAFTAG